MAAPKGNKFAEGLTTSGRPPIYDPEQPEKLYDRIVSYFDYIQGEFHIENKEDKEVVVWDRKPEPETITGLALYLGFRSKGTLYEYAKKNEFSDYVKRALLVVEQKYELQLSYTSPTGAIFALKNMGWKDKQEIEQTVKDITPPKIKFSDTASDEEDS